MQSKNLNEINDICKQSKIRLILIAPPIYQTHRNTYTGTRLKLREDIINNLQSNNSGLIWFNFEKSKEFKLEHFKNDDHLNAKGAQLFTKMLADTLSLNSQGRSIY
jgi:lysophospholipase L1-like esterase